MGENDKGEAASVLIRCYLRHQRMSGQTERIETVGIGGSSNVPPARNGGLPDSRPETRRIL